MLSGPQDVVVAEGLCQKLVQHFTAILTTLRSTSGPYIEIGRLTSDERRDTKWIRALLGMVVQY